MNFKTFCLIICATFTFSKANENCSTNFVREKKWVEHLAKVITTEVNLELNPILGFNSVYRDCRETITLDDLVKDPNTNGEDIVCRIVPTFCKLPSIRNSYLVEKIKGLNVMLRRGNHTAKELYCYLLPSQCSGYNTFVMQPVNRLKLSREQYMARAIEKECSERREFKGYQDSIAFIDRVLLNSKGEKLVTAYQVETYCLRLQRSLQLLDHDGEDPRGVYFILRTIMRYICTKMHDNVEKSTQDIKRSLLPPSMLDDSIPPTPFTPNACLNYIAYSILGRTTYNPKHVIERKNDSSEIVFVLGL